MLYIAVAMLIVALVNLSLWLVPSADVFRSALNLVFNVLLVGYILLLANQKE